MTTPGVPSSPGFPPLEHAAQAAIRAAQDRLGVLTRPRGPYPPRLSAEEREEALKAAATDTCLFCAALHEGASTPACPRLATFKLNGDGKVIEGSFWPDLVSDTATELDEAGNVRAVTHAEHRGWDTSRVVRVSDAAEDGSGGEGDGDDTAFP